MEPKNTIHQGVVAQVDDRKIRVKIAMSDACGHCAGKGACQMLNATERLVEVPLDRHDPAFSVGEQVHVKLLTRSGLKAVFYAYLLPMMVMMACVIVLYLLHTGEGLMALAAIGSLAAYYFLLYLFRERINRKFSFKVEKLAE